MEYFVTGATGFIGKRLVRKLLKRRGALVHFLVRESSLDKVPELLEYWGTTRERAVPVVGDLREPLYLPVDQGFRYGTKSPSPQLPYSMPALGSKIVTRSPRHSWLVVAVVLLSSV